MGVLVLVLLAIFTYWQLDSIERGWIYVIEITAGIAVVWLLRWFWWRVNAWAEISAIVGSFIIANGFVWAELLSWAGILTGSALTAVETFYGSEWNYVRAVFILVFCTIIWVVVALSTKPDSEEKLIAFYRRVRPGGWWGPIAAKCPDVAPGTSASRKWMAFGLGVLFIWTSLLGIGYVMTDRTPEGIALLVLSAIAATATIMVALKISQTPAAPTNS